jgi:archaellum component FlaG (FlaF/FlaG flagellin family)
VNDPGQRPDAQIPPPNDHVYLVKNVGSVRVICWLDAFARELHVRVERP